MTRNAGDVSRETSRNVPRGGNSAPAEPIEGFDHPDDVAAQRQIDSLEHDIRQLAEAEPGGKFRIDEESGEKSLAEILADLDADESAINAARACL